MRSGWTMPYSWSSLRSPSATPASSSSSSAVRVETGASTEAARRVAAASLPATDTVDITVAAEFVA